MKLNFKKFGKGPAIIILHGLFGMSDNWMTIAKMLSRQYCFYLLDLRNHGQSPHSEEFDYTLMANDVAEFLDDHNLKNVNLLGHSMGGKAAISFAVSYAHLIKTLIVVDVANKNYSSSYFENYIDVMLSLNLQEIRTRKEAEKAFLEKLPVYPIVLQFLFKNLEREENGSFSWKLNLVSLKNNLPNILKKVAVPKPIITRTLFMKGAESDYISAEDFRDIKTQFINSRITEIAGANHWVQSTAPHNFIKALTTFINS